MQDGNKKDEKTTTGNLPAPSVKNFSCQSISSISKQRKPINGLAQPAPVIEKKLREIFGRASGLGGIPSGAIKLPEKASTGFFASTLEACLKERIFPRRRRTLVFYYWSGWTPWHGADDSSKEWVVIVQAP